MSLFRELLLGPGLAIAIAGCSGSAQSPGLPTDSRQAACSSADRFVSVGGTGGFNSLVNPDFTTALLATGRVRLYEHGSAIAAAIKDSPPAKPYEILDAIRDVFDGTGPGEAELGLVGPAYFTLPAKSYPGYYRYQYVKSGLNPNAANVDVPYRPRSAIVLSQRNEQIWEHWVEAGRTVGIGSMAPIVAPNAKWVAGSPIFPPTRREYYDVHSSFYALSRFQATYGRGIAFDSPPSFFLGGGSGPGYQGFIEQAIRWGNAQGIRTTVLVSPYLDRSTFSDDTKNFVAALAAHDAIPSEWAVDDYENVNPNDASAMGPDTNANTTTGVGLWLATKAPVFCPGSGSASR